MKKNRPGMLLTVLARPEDASRLIEIVFAETTTIGLRTRRESRITLERRFVTVTTEWGDVRIKLAELNGARSSMPLRSSTTAGRSPSKTRLR